MFLAKHPTQHDMFVNILKSVKHERSNLLFHREDDEMNSEYSNMVKNKNISQFRAEDLHCEQRRKRQKVLKRVTWCENLVNVHEICNNNEENFEEDESEEDRTEQHIEKECSERLVGGFFYQSELLTDETKDVKDVDDKYSSRLLKRKESENKEALQLSFLCSSDRKQFKGRI